MDIVFVSHSAHPELDQLENKKPKKQVAKVRSFSDAQLSEWALSGDGLDQTLRFEKDSLERRFESVFGLPQKQFSQLEQSFAMATFSNLIGGKLNNNILFKVYETC